MALIKFGGGVAGISGKIGGTVFARNKAGAYARNWAVPVNPGTVPQSIVRNNMAAAAANFQTFSLAGVTAWNSYAANMTRLNRQGDPYVPSGRQIYIECYLNALAAGLPVLSTPGPVAVSPAVTNFRLLSAVQLGNVLDQMTVIADNVLIPSGGDPADGKVLFYSAPIHWSQLKNVNKQRRLVLNEDPTALLTGVDISAQYKAYFGDPALTGQIVDVWCKLIDPLTMLASPFYLSTIQVTT